MSSQRACETHTKKSSVMNWHRKSQRNIHIPTGNLSPDDTGRWTGAHKTTLLIFHPLCHPATSRSIAWNVGFLSCCADIVSLIRHQVKWWRHWYCSRRGYQSLLRQVGLFHVAVTSSRWENNVRGEIPKFCLEWRISPNAS
jgi:hypothetical protein